jgi:hypothetical protein
MSTVELLSWKIDTNLCRLYADAIVEDIELPQRAGDYQADYVLARCSASVLLGDLSDWPETEADRLDFLGAHAEWKIIDDGEE